MGELGLRHPRLSFRGASHKRVYARLRRAMRASLESITTTPEYGFRARRCAAPRNDGAHHRPYSLSAPGRPSSIPAFAGPFRFPSTDRGDGAPSGAPVFRLAAFPHENAGASRRRVSWFMRRFLFGHPSAASTADTLFGPPETIGPFPVQRAPRGAPVVAPDRVPGPPECGVTSPARRRRIPPRYQNVS